MAAFRTSSVHLWNSLNRQRADRYTGPHVADSRRFRVLLGSLALFTCFAVDAAVRFPGALDLATMKFVQRLDFEQLGPRLEVFERLTDSPGAVFAWGATLMVFSLLRWWLPVLGVLAIPIGGVVNETISRVLIHRTRPHLEELRHVSQNFEDRSFPSGHVVGAMLLYGFIWYVAGDRIRFAPVRWLIRAVCAVVIVLSGFDRVWSGAHWPSDVGGAYALGLALLLALTFACEWIEREAAGLRRNEGVLALFMPASTGGDMAGAQGLRGRIQVLMVALRPMVLALAPPTGAQPDGSAPEASRGH
jgi:membrane-associated phospholipid phosphatase